MAEAQAKQALKNGKDLKQVLTALKENRDQIEQSTGKRPDIDDTTKLFMQKVLNVWISEGRDIDPYLKNQRAQHAGETAGSNGRPLRPYRIEKLGCVA